MGDWLFCCAAGSLREGRVVGSLGGVRGVGMIATEEIAKTVCGEKPGGVSKMIVNMKPEATEEQIQHVIERIKECGFQAHVIRGAERTVIGAVGSGGRRGELEALLVAPGVEALIPISAAVQAGGPRAAPRAHRGRRGRRADRRRELGGDCRAVLGGIARADAGDGARRTRCRRFPAARRGLQAAHFALRFSGAGRGGAGDLARRRARKPGCRS